MKRYSDLKFKHKVTLVMSTLLLTMILALTILFTSYFRAEYEEKSITLAQEWSSIGMKRLEQVWNPLKEEIISVITNDDFAKTLLNRGDSKADMLNTSIKLQHYFNKIKNSSFIVDSAYIVTDENDVYTLYEDFPKDSSNLLSYDYLKESKTMTLLPSMDPPFRNGEKVIPIICSLSRYGKFPFLMLSDDGNPEAILVVLLSESKIEKLLENNTTQFIFHIQLTNEDNEDILCKDPVPWEKTIAIDTPTDIKGIHITMNIDATTFMPLQKTIIKFTVIIAVVFYIIGIIAIFFISKKLTAPFQKITRMLDRIKDNTYHFEAQAKYKDETGELITGINVMYSTILENMEVIRKTENEKFQYLSKMLTEQTNPHFIYNTLEMINMEIQRGNINNASNMITFFAIYLRTTLNNGEDLNSIEEQARNVEAYFKIMNARLNGSINLKINAPKELGDVMIPKSIMQPIVENAIKHGFDYARNISEFILPEINIDISGTEKEIIISIYDNGKGIDIEKTEQLMLTDEKKAHLGISNIYKRLRIYDSEANIEIFSVPYFKNEFKITFHPKVCSK